MKYQEKLLAYIDLLGFKNLVSDTIKDGIFQEDKFDKIILIYQKISELFIINDEHFQIYDKSISQFSDSLVISYYIGDEPEKLLFLLESLHQLQVILINLGIIIRGSVVIEDIFHNNFKLINGKESKYNIIFGPAIIKAYLMESKKAIFPRIILDNKVINLFRKIDFSHLSPEMYEKEKFDKAIRKDYDEYYYLDYIGNPDVFFLPDNIDVEEYNSNLKSLMYSGLQNINKRIQDKYLWMKTKYEKAST